MQWTSLALILCSTAALGWACCTPDQWEGKQSLFSGYAGIFHRGLIKEFNDVAYDYANNRSAVFLRYVNGDVEAKIKIVVLYEDGKGTLYVDNYNKKRCWKKTLKREFRKACVPEEAKELGDYSLGLKGKYNVKSFNIKGKRMDSILTVQEVSEGVCAPIGELSFGRVSHYDVLRNVGFVDITAGIKNATVFDKPKDCKENWDDFDLPIDIERQDYILGV